MKKIIFASLCLLLIAASVVVFAKDSSNKKTFATCTHFGGFHQYRYQAEADLAGWKKAMKNYAIIEEEHIYEIEGYGFTIEINYTAEHCNLGD